MLTNTKRVLILSGDIWHPTSILRKGFEHIDSSMYQIDWMDRLDEQSVDQIFNYSLVILAKANHFSETNKQPWVSDKVDQVLLEYVQQGNGLLVFHSGLAEYEDAVAIRKLTGGVFLQHPEQCQVTIGWDNQCMITKNSEPFTLQDEHYFVDIDDPDADIFMVATSEHGTQPAGWTRTEGKGRVCVLIPSHNVEVLTHPAFQNIVTNAMNWCHHD